MPPTQRQAGSGLTATRLGDVARLVVVGAMDCGVWRLLLVTRAMRRLEHDDLIGIGRNVAVTNPNTRVTDGPLSLAEVFAVVTDTVAARDAAIRSGREVFRCA